MVLEGCTVLHFPRQERLTGSTGVRGERESSIVCVFTLPGVISAPQDHLITGGICGWTHAAFTWPRQARLAGDCTAA